MSEWKSNVEDASGTIESDLRTASSETEAKDVVVNFMGTVVQETDTMLGEMREAGVPKIKNGNKVARVFESGLIDLRNLFAGAQETAANLNATDPAQFQAAASDIEDTLTEGVEEFEQTIDRAERKYKATKRALTVPACEL